MASEASGTFERSSRVSITEQLFKQPFACLEQFFPPFCDDAGSVVLPSDDNSVYDSRHGNGTSARAATISTIAAVSPQGFRVVSFLSVGRRFIGRQVVTTSAHTTADQWRVNVELLNVDLSHGTAYGTMEAREVPRANSRVITFWRGEIIDNVNFHFYTQDWSASPENDIAHWSRFDPFRTLCERVKRDGGRDIDLSGCRYVFMRWKEIFFVNVGEDCGLTIAGFYYICLDRRTGVIHGFYFDPKSEPFQCLQLSADHDSEGFAFPTSEFS